MTDSYSGGYKAALLDIYNFLQPDRRPVAWTGDSKKKYQTIVLSLLKLLLQNDIAREEFMNLGGYVWVKQSENGEILDVGEKERILAYISI